MQYESTRTIQSNVCPGVQFTIARMSFGRRIDLMRRVRQLSARMEFAIAGAGVDDRLQASLLGAEIDELYLRWGLQEISGLELDGQQASVDTMIAAAPEALCQEVIAAIKGECALTEDERKN